MQQCDSLICKHAIRSPAIGHDLLVLGKISGSIFFSRTHIEQDDIALDQALEQFRRTYWLQYVPIVQVGIDYTINLCYASFSYVPHGLPEGEHMLVSQMIVDVNTFAAHLDKLGSAQYLQML